jgi:site-specific DNA-methyltransferase (adenine-specific)
MKRFINKILQGDAFELIDTLPDESVDLVVTSPPYADIKSYGKGVSIFHPDRYVDWLLPLNDKVHRVLKPSGHFVINIGDKTLNCLRHPYAFDYILRSVKETKMLYYDRYIWEKASHIPNGSEKRFNNSIEWIFHFVKDTEKMFWDMDKVREPYAESSIGRAKYDGHIYETGEDGKKTSKKKSYSLNKKGRVPSCVVKFQTNAVTRGNPHPAPYHLELPSFYIKCLTSKDGIVLDPFMGSGTTAEAALQLGRKFIGFDMEQNYIDYATKRISQYLMMDDLFE